MWLFSYYIHSKQVLKIFKKLITPEIQNKKICKKNGPDVFQAMLLMTFFIRKSYFLPLENVHFSAGSRLPL